MQVFQWDEVFFLHASFQISRADAAFDYYPSPFMDALAVLWRLLDRDLAWLWTVRAALALIVVLQSSLVYWIICLSDPGERLCPDWIRPVMIAGYITAMTSYRGYEVRPEAFCNLLILFGFAIFMRTLIQHDRSSRTGLLIASAGLGVAAATGLSERYFLIGLVLLAGLVLAARAHGYLHRSLAALFGPAILLLIILHLIEYSIFDRVQLAADFQSQRVVSSIGTRLSIGGSSFQIPLMLIVVVAWGAAVVRIWTLRRDYRATLSVSVPLVMYLGFLLFLFAFDIQPYEYIRSIEFLLLTMGVLSLTAQLVSLDVARASVRLHSTIMLVCMALMCYEALLRLERNAPTFLIVKHILGSSTPRFISTMEDRTLVALMLNRKSIFDQIHGQKEYCRRYPDGLATVEDWRDFPVCMSTGKSRIEMANEAVVSRDFNPAKFQFVSTGDERDFRSAGLRRLDAFHGRSVWIRNALVRSP